MENIKKEAAPEVEAQELPQNILNSVISTLKVENIKSMSDEEQTEVFRNITLDDIDKIPEDYGEGFELYLRAIKNDVVKLKSEMLEVKRELAELLAKLS